MKTLVRFAFILGAGLLRLKSVVGIQTAVAVYDDNSCTAPARFVTITNPLTCKPQVNSYQPICESAGEAYHISDCVNYYQWGDDIGFIWRALMNYPYLVVQKYTASRCGSREYMSNTTMYRLDENCYSNAAGTASHRLTLGHSAIITTYSDGDCTTVASTTTVEQKAMGWGQSGNCLDDVMTLYGGTRPNVTAVAVYDDATCSSIPTQIKFSQDFTCSAPSNGMCENHLVSTCVSDLSSFTAEKFGASNPYVIVEEFSNPWCYSMEYATAYSADGSCHTTMSDDTSFRAIINADSTDSTVVIITYVDSACTVVANSTNLDSVALTSSRCIQQNSCSDSIRGCSKRYSVGGLKISSIVPRRVAVSVYSDSPCTSAPIQVSITNVLVCPPLSGTCDPIIAGTTGVFEVQECIDDYDSFAIARYGLSPYLIIESYGIGTNCRVQDKVRIYAGDGKCHFSAFDGNYFAIMQSPDSSVVIVTYPTSACANGGSVSIVESWNINTDNCVEGNRKYRTSEIPLATFSLSATPAPTPTQGPPTWTPTPTTTIPFCIPPTTTPSPSWTPPSPPTQTEKEVDPLDIMFPAWLWDPTPPRVFVDDGLHRPHHSPGRPHEFPDHRRFP